MRCFLNDVANAMDHEHKDKVARTKGIPLYGNYIARKIKPTHSRPLPLPDALLANGSALEEPDEPEQEWAWIRDVAQGPWLWKLQYATLAMLMISAEFRTALQTNCPQHVNDKWLASLHTRLETKLLGVSTATGFPGVTAALTPLMTVISELMLLKTTYELP